jgi:AraC-like DNA-binding protein
VGEPGLGRQRTPELQTGIVHLLLDRLPVGANTPGREAAMPIVLNFDGVGPGDRAEFWREACAETFVGVDVRGAADEPIGGSVRAYDLDDLIVGEIDASGQFMARTRRLIDRADNQYLLLGIQTRGTGRVAQGDRRSLLQPGDCALFESHRPFELNFDAAFDLWVFAFPQHLVRLGARDRRQLAAQRVNARTGPAGVARRALLDLAVHGEEFRGPPSGGALALANDLLVTLLSAPLSESSKLAGSMQRSLPLRMKDYINQRLADPALTPAQVAAAFGISTRYLHKVFEGGPETVAHYIRGRRLERCRLRLLDPRFANQTVSTLAFEAGFGDLSGFNRAFKARYGLSPRQLRSAPRSVVASRS